LPRRVKWAQIAETHKEGYHGPHLASDHHGGDAFRPRLNSPFLGGVGFWLLFSVLSAVVTFYFLKHDPGLVESRLKVGPTAEREKSQKVIQTLTAILWCALIIVPGIERHFDSSRIPVALVVLGDATVAVGYYIVFLAPLPHRWPWARSGPSCAQCCLASSQRGSRRSRIAASGRLTPLMSWVSMLGASKFFANIPLPNVITR
jgi:hypothetical protein